jgi:phosphatidylglycerol:prolipoprotein diacylglycerol transferase
MLPWRMNGDVPNAYLNGLGENLDPSKWGVHPTFLYESLWDIAVFVFLLWMRKKKKLDGEVISFYLILYGIGRAMIEGLRTDSLYIGNTGIRVSQLLSALLAIIFAVLFVYRRTRRKKAEEEEAPVEVGQSQYGSLLLKLKEEQEKEAEENAKTAEAGVEAEAEGKPEAEVKPEEAEDTGEKPEAEEKPEADDKPDSEGEVK